MIAWVVAAAVSTSSAQLAVSGFLGWQVGDGPWQKADATVDLPVTEDGAAIRFSGHSSLDVMDRWYVIEAGHRYTAKPGGCDGIAFEDTTATGKRRGFVQVSLDKMPNEAMPWKVLDGAGKELDSIERADIGGSFDTPFADPKCPAAGSRLRIVDSHGASRFDLTIHVPDERFTRISPLPQGGFDVAVWDASEAYEWEEIRRVDPVKLAGLTITGVPYEVRHVHGGPGAGISFAIFRVKNGGRTAQTLSVSKIKLLKDYGDEALTPRGISFADDDSMYGEAGEPRKSVVLAPGQTKYVRAWFEPTSVYLVSYMSWFRFSVDFTAGGKTATAGVPLDVMRFEPLRRPDDGDFEP